MSLIHFIFISCIAAAIVLFVGCTKEQRLKSDCFKQGSFYLLDENGNTYCAVPMGNINE